MTLHRSFAVLLLAASLSSGVLAQRDVRVDDETIFVAVEGALHDEHSLARAEIKVHSRDGFVTLTGVAATWQDVATAGRLASRVRGVTGINNRILVAGRFRST